MKSTYKIVVLGPGGVGKTKGTTTLIEILQSIGFETSWVKPWTEDMVTTSNYVVHNFTIPDNYFTDVNKKLFVSIFDLGGQFKFDDMWLQHAYDTDALVVVVDMTRKTTLHQVTLMLPKGILGGVPVRLLVNKADLFREFAEHIDNTADKIMDRIEQTIENNMVNYNVIYKNDEKFIFNSRVYKYGDTINVMRSMTKDHEGNPMIRLGDLEAIVTQAFKSSMPGLTDHNCALFGREFTLQVFEKIYKQYDAQGTVLDDDLLRRAHNEAPPFLSWGNDPEIFLPLTIINHDLALSTLETMLVDENDLITMVQELREHGYNINIEAKNGWAFTSAVIYAENPTFAYQPMHKAILPPFFIKDMITYSTHHEDNGKNYFV